LSEYSKKRAVVVYLSQQDTPCDLIRQSGSTFLKGCTVETLETRKFAKVFNFGIVTVPLYNHAYQDYLPNFRREHGDEFKWFDEDLTHENYPGSEMLMWPGARFLVEAFAWKSEELLANLDTRECMLALDSQGVRHSQAPVYLGPYGVSMLYQQKLDLLVPEEEDVIYVSFDEPRRVPYIGHGPNPGHRMPILLIESINRGGRKHFYAAADGVGWSAKRVRFLYFVRY
jgi:hypothetical protein